MNLPFYLSTLPKKASQIGFIQLCYHLLFSTQSKASKHLQFEFQPPNSTFSYVSIIKTLTETRRFLQSLLLFKKILPFSKPDIFLFPSLLKSCAFLHHLNYGFSIHGYLVKCGFTNWVGAGNSLILMYMKFGQPRDAYRVFEEMPDRNSDVFNSLIYGFGSNGSYDEVLVTFERMVELCVLPTFGSVRHVIKACGELRSIEKAILVHDFVIKQGLGADVLIANSLISMYVKIGRLDFAHRVFSDMHDRDIVSWNSLITGYAHGGNWAEALELFLYMRKSGNLVPNLVTLLGLLSACGQAGNLDLGMSIHGHMISSGLLYDFRLGTAIVDMYSKCERLDFARIVFEEDLSEKTLVSWNSLIAGYSQNGHDEEAAVLYERMIMETNLKPDSITFANVVPAYASLTNYGRIQTIHSLIVKKALDLDGDVVLGTAMLNAYGKCSDVRATISLFNYIKRPNTATWNSLMAAYNVTHQAKLGMLVFVEMLQSEMLPDPITMVMLLQSCGELGSLNQGSMIHGFSLTRGFSSHLIVGNAIIDMYMRCGCVKSSEVLFSAMSLKNRVTWNTMIYGYVKVGYPAMAIRIFCRMQSENMCRPDSVTMISLVQASAAVWSSCGAEISHAYILKLSLDSETLVKNSLIDAYAKNGLVEKARILFNQFAHLRDESSWNVMICGCGMNGQGREACNLISRMEEDGYKPNSITFISLLSSCSHSGLIEEGCRFFNLMITKYKIRPGMEHWTCIIDMLGRAGKLEDAYRIIKSVSHQNLEGHVLLDCKAVWGALLSACRMNMNMEVGGLAAEELSKLEPNNGGYHSLMSNLYASSDRWDDVIEIRRVFEDGRLVKKPGLSIMRC